MTHPRTSVGTREGARGTGLPRWFDILAAFTGLAVSAPLLALLGVIIAATSPGPMLFQQERVGLKGRRFRLYKLRTMRFSNEPFRLATADDARVTGVGKVLRKMKLDELPQLWNVLRGDMSLVGPRPEVPQYVNLDDPSWQLVLEVRPGITDPLSLLLVNEANLLTERKGDSERFYLDTLQPYKLRGYLQYLERRSWHSDLKVLLDTALVPFSPGRRPAPTAEDLNSQN